MKRPFFISRATWAMIQEARRTPNYSWFDFLHGYIYLRWPYFYIGVGTGEHPLAKAVAPVANWLIERLGKKPEEQTDAERTTFADTYHGKVMPLDDAKRLVTVQEEIRAPDLERVIPYTMARALILRHPEHIAVLDCPCRSARPDPCLPLDVCLIIGEPFAGLVREHHPERSRSITAEEAVAILQAEDERGHVHHAFFKDAMLGRFYAICNCCACCCGAMQAQRNGVPDAGLVGLYLPGGRGRVCGLRNLRALLSIRGDPNGRRRRWPRCDRCRGLHGLRRLHLQMPAGCALVSSSAESGGAVENRALRWCVSPLRSAGLVETPPPRLRNDPQVAFYSISIYTMNIYGT